MSFKVDRENISALRTGEREQNRIEHILEMVPNGLNRVLDAGARDGHLSKILLERCQHVTALDLYPPTLDHPNIDCVHGDITSLDYPDDSFDLVFCSEVLEHIPEKYLAQAAHQMVRVARKHLIIGVPYRQDLRVACTTCSHCKQVNPPWGHVNSFDEQILSKLFHPAIVKKTELTGDLVKDTNFISAKLFEMAGNPYGTYEQEEACVHCGESIGKPRRRALVYKLVTKLGFWTQSAGRILQTAHSSWIHVHFEL